MIKKQFVTRDIAILLEEIGCNERFGDYECTYYYKDELLCFCNNEYIDVWDECRFVKAPLWQQVIDWFREKYQIIIAIHAYHDLDAVDEADQILWDFTLWDKDWNDISDYTYYHSYEEAREAAILEAIKIVKGGVK